MNAHDDAHGGLNAAVAATLNGERTAAGLTHDDLAELSGVNKRTLMRLLKAQRDIDVNVMAALAAVFNLTPAELLAKAEDWQRRTDPEAAREAAGTRETVRRLVEEGRVIARREDEGDDVVLGESSRNIHSAKRRPGSA